MELKSIKSKHFKAEVHGHDGTLVLESEHESVTVHGHVNGEVDLQLLLNERELFKGSASMLEGALEAAAALTNLKSNHTLRQVLTQLADNGDASAILRFLSLVR